jgi:hypothetical protein
MLCIQRNLMLRVGSIGKQTSASHASFSTRAVSEARRLYFNKHVALEKQPDYFTGIFYRERSQIRKESIMPIIPSRLGSGAFWQRQSQNAVFELGFRFCLVYFHRQRDGSFEQAIAALHAILAFLVFLSLVFLLTPNFERSIPNAHVNILSLRFTGGT